MPRLEVLQQVGWSVLETAYLQAWAAKLVPRAVSLYIWAATVLLTLSLNVPLTTLNIP